MPLARLHANPLGGNLGGTPRTVRGHTERLELPPVPQHEADELLLPDIGKGGR